MAYKYRVMIIAFSLSLLGIFIAPGGASAQMRRGGPGYHPLQRNVTGFMQLSVGLIYPPFTELEGESHNSGDDFTISNDESSGPGYSVAFYFIPTWGKNGVYFGASYSFSSLSFNHETGRGNEAVSGESSLGISDMIARVGYVRYFGEYKWHPYLLGGAGLSWQTARMGTSYDGLDDKVEDSKINTPVIDVGVGIGRQSRGNMWGAQLKADYYPMTLEHEFPGPYERFDLNITRPIVLKIMAVFSFGHL